VAVNKHKFLLSVQKKGLSWPEADAKAVAHGVNWALATLDSRAEADQVIRLLRERGCNLAGKVWLGGNSLAEADQWVWPDGKQVSDDTAMWGRGEPAPGGGECMVLAEREWQAVDCLDDTSVKTFLAHHRTAEPPTQPPSTKPPKRTTTELPRETTDPGRPQTPS